MRKLLLGAMIVLIILKLSGVITISWGWILAPVIVGALILSGVIGLVYFATKDRKK